VNNKSRIRYFRSTEHSQMVSVMANSAVGEEGEEEPSKFRGK
jgi:hypothetical protein